MSAAMVYREVLALANRLRFREYLFKTTRRNLVPASKMPSLTSSPQSRPIVHRKPLHLIIPMYALSIRPFKSRISHKWCWCRHFPRMRVVNIRSWMAAACVYTQVITEWSSLAKIIRPSSVSPFRSIHRGQAYPVETSSEKLFQAGRSTATRSRSHIRPIRLKNETRTTRSMLVLTKTIA